MPLTFPAHQAFVVPMKLRWPTRFDGTALCVGAAVPDLTYPFLLNRGQTLLGGLVVGVPLTLVTCVVLRLGAAEGVFANLPDLGMFRVHSYRVITRRRPALLVTLSSAAIGVLSHVAVDSLTHDDRRMSRIMGFDTVVFHTSWKDAVTIAWLLQMVGHVVGSLVGLALFAHIGRRRLLGAWYSTEVVAEARRFELSPGDRIVFWAVVALSVGVTYVAFIDAEIRVVFKLILGGVVGLLVSGVLRRGRVVPNNRARHLVRPDT